MGSEMCIRDRTRPGTEELENKLATEPNTAGSCEPGPDSDLENLVLPEDKEPADQATTEKDNS